MMMVENSFDRWSKDVFFSAAEEVQESADMYVFFCFLKDFVIWVLCFMTRFCGLGVVPFFFYFLGCSLI